MNLYSNHNHLALLTDLYELTMSQGYFHYKKNLDVVFDFVFRREPFNSGFSVFAGLEPLINTISHFKFSDDDIYYLQSLKLFKNDFLQFLKNFKFTGDLYSVEEGEVVFPQEPLLRVHANIIEAQLLESIILNVINFQTLIATKTARMVEAAQGRSIMEFGLRRAQGIDGSLSATRAAFIGGATSTSNVMAGKIFGIPVRGTMAHSWIMVFPSELEAFQYYTKLYPETTILLIDTYNTLKSGIPNTIKVLKQLKKKGIKNFGIRLDSGDLEYLSKQARNMLDKADLKEVKIVVSNELDEYVIEQLIKNNAPIDLFGVGTHLVTGKGDPALTGVFKLVAKKVNHNFQPTLKVSNNPEKATNPGVKNIFRLYHHNQMMGDLIYLESEKSNMEKIFHAKKDFIFYHPDYDYKYTKMSQYNSYKILLQPIIQKGELVYSCPPLCDIQKNTRKNLSRLHTSHKRLLNPHIYKVSITPKLMNVKMKLIKAFSCWSLVLGFLLF